MASWLETELITVLAPLVKPEVDAYTAALKADEPTIVADIEKYAGTESNYAQAAATAFVDRLPSGGIFGFVRPYVQTAIAAGIAGLVGTVDGNAQAWFDAAYAKIVAVEAALGL